MIWEKTTFQFDASDPPLIRAEDGQLLIEQVDPSQGRAVDILFAADLFPAIRIALAEAAGG